MKTIFLFAIATLAWAELNPERTRLLGTWRVDEKTWSLEAVDEKMHLIRAEEGHELANFACNTMGRECSIQWGGNDAKVSLWFNGSMLVMMSTQKDKVIKRRFSVSESGERMKLERIPVVPAGQSQNLYFDRVRASESDQATDSIHGAPSA
jgi:hypothetical protein